ncbi:hypothetical protein ACFQMM_02705 [Saliphagus sp. GCM10025308]
MSGKPKRRRISADAAEIVDTHAEQQGCSKREMLEKMISAYDDRGELLKMNQRQTEQLDRLCEALLDGTDTASTNNSAESSKTDESRNTTGNADGAELEIDPNKLPVDHDLELDPDAQDWNEIVKERKEPSVAALRGFLHHRLANLDTIPERFLDEAIDALDRHSSSKRRYKFQYGEDLDVWYPHPSIDPDFKPNKAYDRIIEEKQKATRFNKSKVTDEHPDLKSCFPKATDGLNDGEKESPVVKKTVFYSNIDNRDSMLIGMADRTTNYMTTHGSKRAGVIYLSYLIHFAEEKDIGNESWRSLVRDEWADHKYWVEDW